MIPQTTPLFLTYRQRQDGPAGSGPLTRWLVVGWLLRDGGYKPALVRLDSPSPNPLASTYTWPDGDYVYTFDEVTA